MRKFVHDEGGQAIVEYILLSAVVVSVMLAFSLALRRSVIALWRHFHDHVSAGCPTGCQKPDSL